MLTFSRKDQEYGVEGTGVSGSASKTPDGPRQIVANTPSPPLPRKSPESPLKRPPNKPKILCSNSLDPQLPSQYTHNTQKRVLSAPGKVWRIQLVEKLA